MVNNIDKATTKEELIALFHPELIKQIPADKIDEIALNLLLVENYFKNIQHLKPEDVKATRIYSHSMNQITQVDYEGVTYAIVQDASTIQEPGL
jgi:glycosylphosphatidylinositol transamidase (GPIT) subunit GPI8